MILKIGDRVEFIGHIVEGGVFATKDMMEKQGIDRLFGTIAKLDDIVFESFSVTWENSDGIGEGCAYKPSWLQLAPNTDIFNEDFLL